jgi:large subunit ribosomal protein L10e
MGKRAARCYRKVKGHSYTRTSMRRQSKSYIKGVPGSQIHTFDMGTQKSDYDIRIDFVSTDHMRIGHSALEACRVSANKFLDANIGTEDYYFKVRVYPHEVLREHAIVTGAGADRISSGMARAFGRPSGRAAKVKKGTRVLSVYTSKNNLDHVKGALKLAGMKLPVHYYLEIVDLKGK